MREGDTGQGKRDFVAKKESFTNARFYARVCATKRKKRIGGEEGYKKVVDGKKAALFIRKGGPHLRGDNQSP